MPENPGSTKVRQWLAALLAGALFATGLVVSGMTQPAKVIGFLNVAAWLIRCVLARETPAWRL